MSIYCPQCNVKKSKTTKKEKIFVHNVMYSFFSHFFLSFFLHVTAVRNFVLMFCKLSLFIFGSFCFAQLKIQVNTDIHVFDCLFIACLFFIDASDKLHCVTTVAERSIRKASQHSWRAYQDMVWVETDHECNGSFTAWNKRCCSETEYWNPHGTYVNQFIGATKFICFKIVWCVIWFIQLKKTNFHVFNVFSTPSVS